MKNRNRIALIWITVLMIVSVAARLSFVVPAHAEGEEDDWGTWILIDSSLEYHDPTNPKYESYSILNNGFTYRTWTDEYEHAGNQGQSRRLYFVYTVTVDDPPKAIPIGEEYLAEVNVQFSVEQNDFGNSSYTYQFIADLDVYDKKTGDREAHSRMESGVLGGNGSYSGTAADAYGAVSAYPEDWNENHVLRIAYHFGNCRKIYTYKYQAPGPVDIVDNQDANKDPGEGNSTNIPSNIVVPGGNEKKFPWLPVAVGGIAALTVIGALTNKKKGEKKPDSGEPKKSSGSTEDKKERKMKSTFRMVIYKDFGDTFEVGEEPKAVCARIEEKREDGMVRDRPDLSEQIQVSVSEGMEITRTSFDGKYKKAWIIAKEDKTGRVPETGTVTFVYATKKGSVTNNIKFRLLDGMEIKFTQETITFIAGEGQSSFIAFFVKGLGDNPTFEMTLAKGCRENFEVSEVKPAECNCWKIEIREKGEKKHSAGSMEYYDVTLTASMPADGERAERKVTGSFNIARFHEGMLMRVADLKAYLVKYGTEQITGQEDTHYDKGQMMTPAHTRLELNFFTWDTEEKVLTNPVPDELEMHFEDVESEVEFRDEEGRSFRNPVEKMDFKFNVLDVYGNNNTVLIEIAATGEGGFLIPPARGQAKIRVNAKWEDHTFEQTKTVNLISMPRRTASEKENAYAKDMETVNKITHMIEEMYKHNGAYEMRPLIHRLELILDGYDADFGFYMPEVQDCMVYYLKWVHGVIGSRRKAEDLSCYEYFFGDTAEQTLKDWERTSLLRLGIRIWLAYKTAGASEVHYFIPRDVTVAYIRSLKKAGEAANSSDNVLKNFTVGLYEAGWIALKEYAYMKGGEYIVAPTLKFSGLVLKENAKELLKESSKFASKIKGIYTRTAWAMRSGKAAAAMKELEKKAEASVAERLARGREFMKSNPEMLKQSKIYEEYMDDAAALLKRYEKALSDPNITEKELNLLTHQVQSNKACYDLMNAGAVSRKVVSRFNQEIGIIHDRIILQTRKEIAAELGTHVDNIRVFKATTNDPGLLKGGYKSAGDLDVTLTDIRTGEDIASNVVNKKLGKNYYENIYGESAPSQQAADYLREKADITGVAKGDAESYDDAIKKIMDPSLDHEAYGNIDKVAETSVYKTEQWLNKDADSAGEAIMNRWEGGRQYMKTNARINYRNAKAVIEDGKMAKLPMEDLQALKNDDALFKTTMTYKDGKMGNYIEYEAALKAEGKDLMSGIKQSAETMRSIENIQLEKDLDIFDDIYGAADDFVESAAKDFSGAEYGADAALRESFFKNAETDVTPEEVADFFEPENRVNLVKVESVNILEGDNPIPEEKLQSAVETDELVNRYFTYENCADLGSMLEFMAALAEKSMTVEDAVKENQEVNAMIDEALGI